MDRAHLQQVSVDGTKAGQAVGTAEGRAAIQRDLKRAKTGILKFSKGKSLVLRLGRSNPKHQDTSGADLQRRTWGSWWTPSWPRISDVPS